MAPLAKLIKIRETIEMIKREVRPTKQAIERSDLLSILIYAMVYTQVEDLSA